MSIAGMKRYEPRWMEKQREEAIGAHLVRAVEIVLEVGGPWVVGVNCTDLGIMKALALEMLGIPQTARCHGKMPYAALWWECLDVRNYQLFSLHDGSDVGQVARRLGGDGDSHTAHLARPVQSMIYPVAGAPLAAVMNSVREQGRTILDEAGPRPEDLPVGLGTVRSGTAGGEVRRPTPAEMRPADRENA